MNNFEKLKTALIATGIPTYHNRAFEQTDRYIVWSQVAKLYEHGDNKATHTGWRIAIDFFTTTEYDEVSEIIEKKLESAGISIVDCARDYEEETGYTHYAYTAEDWVDG